MSAVTLPCLSVLSTKLAAGLPPILVVIFCAGDRYKPLSPAMYFRIPLFFFPQWYSALVLHVPFTVFIFVAACSHEPLLCYWLFYMADGCRLMWIYVHMHGCIACHWEPP